MNNQEMQDNLEQNKYYGLPWYVSFADNATRGFIFDSTVANANIKQFSVPFEYAMQNNGILSSKPLFGSHYWGSWFGAGKNGKVGTSSEFGFKKMKVRKNTVSKASLKNSAGYNNFIENKPHYQPNQEVVITGKGFSRGNFTETSKAYNSIIKDGKFIDKSVAYDQHSFLNKSVSMESKFTKKELDLFKDIEKTNALDKLTSETQDGYSLYQEYKQGKRGWNAANFTDDAVDFAQNIGGTSKEKATNILNFVSGMAKDSKITNAELNILNKQSLEATADIAKSVGKTIDEYYDDVAAKGVQVLKKISPDVFKKVGPSNSLFGKIATSKLAKIMTGVALTGPAALVATAVSFGNDVADYGQQNAINNFITAHLQNTDNSYSMTTSSSVAIQSANNIYNSNIEDYTSILKNMNTSSDYLNNLDPINNYTVEDKETL